MPAQEGCCIGQKLSYRFSFTNWTIIALEEVLISMCWNSRAITFHFNCKTQWQMFLLLCVRHICARCKALLYLGETLLWIIRKWKTAETQLLARQFNMYESSIISQILDFVYWTVMILVLIAWIRSSNDSIEFVQKRREMAGRRNGILLGQHWI